LNLFIYIYLNKNWKFTSFC